MFDKKIYVSEEGEKPNIGIEWIIALVICTVIIIALFHTFKDEIQMQIYKIRPNINIENTNTNTN